jgi:hypothetical protein
MRMADCHKFSFGEVLEVVHWFLAFSPQRVDVDFLILIDLSLEHLLLVVFEHFPLEFPLGFSFQVEDMLILLGSIRCVDVGSLVRQCDFVFFRVDFFIMIFEVNVVRKLVGAEQRCEEMLIDRKHLCYL